MFYKYLLANNEGKESLFLYLMDKFEFAREYENKDINRNIYDKTYKYINDNKIDFNGDKVYFVKEGNTIGSINLSDYDYFHHSYVELIDEDNKFYFNEAKNLIDRVKIEEYIFSVISKEVPAIIEKESLKSQAVITRTYLYKRLSRNLPISSFNNIPMNKNYLKAIWGNDYLEYQKLIINAIKDTRDEVIKFGGDYIDSYYHLASNTKTEDSSNVLKLSYPYLVSVETMDNKEPNYRIVPNKYLTKLLNTKINKNTKVEILIRTIGHRVKYIKFNDKVFDGLILGKRLGLDSNDYKVEINDKYTTFTVYGSGNGLGLSQYGAENMAKNGYNYKQILKHYYPNTYIENEN